MPTHSPWNALLCCNLSARVDKSNPLTFKEKWFCSCVYFVLAFSVSCILHQRNVTSLNVSTCFVHIIAMKIHSLDRPPPPPALRMWEQNMGRNSAHTQVRYRKINNFPHIFVFLLKNFNVCGSVWVDFYPFSEQRTIFRALLELLRGLNLECAETCRRITNAWDVYILAHVK